MRPEQSQALSYIRRAGTEASADSVRRRFADAAQKIEDAVAGIDAASARRRPGPDRWSVQEIVDHLAETNRRGVEELRELLQGRSPADGPIPASLVSEQPLEPTWDEARQRLAEGHRQLLELLEPADDPTPLDAKAKVVMVVNARSEDGPEVLEWIEEFDWKAYVAIARMHTLGHIAQIERTLAA